MAYDNSQQDEGYSEDPLTVGVSSGPAGSDSWVQSLPAAQRTDYVMAIMSQLTTSEVCEIVRRLRPRLYINFFQYLPPEVCLKILGYLDPISLINTAQASREWMQLALDRKLWEQLYRLEGFRVHREEMRNFEDSLNVDRSRSNEFTNDEQPNKRRATPRRILPAHHVDSDSEMVDTDTPVVKQASLFGPYKESRSDVDENMPDISSIPSLQKGKGKLVQHLTRSPSSSFQEKFNSERLSPASVLSKKSVPMANMSSLVVVDRGDNKRKLNWQYLYSQRRRLEANWEAEKFTNFQLPHPDYLHEAHRECIYTIQYSGKYLVSGSRDKTLRIWDLDTRRLVRNPLAAHNGSVLCLQFDASPEEDIIISGSSDSSVIVWKFSTGKVMQKLRKAHRESVLNIRFDKRVLVTCSKDKTIKIFNRRPMGQGEMGYNIVQPAPTFNLNDFGYQPTPSVGPLIKPAWSMIACLQGHCAAVNAVQIYGNEVVSVSGDRTVKVWNWPEQICTKTLIGHTKGIACVQYDGRRIVSGSSDNEVKIFDKESGLEVASLRAHTNLVRTVQAGFGDLPYSEEEDKEDAKTIDNEYFKALDAGVINRTGPFQRNRPRNAGSRKPEDITAYGAKIPPGGGGGKFGRIVSGSYDESIIIWKRDKEGVWKPMHMLRQDPAIYTPIASFHRSSRGNVALNPTLTTAHGAAPDPSQQQSLNSATPSSWYIHTIDSAIQHGPSGLRHALRAHPQLLTHPHLVAAINATPNAIRQALMNQVIVALNSQQQNTGTADSGIIASSSGSHASNNVQTSALTQASSSTITQAAQGLTHLVTQPPTQVTQGPLVLTPTQTTPAVMPPATHAPVAAPAAAAAAAPAPQQPPHHLPQIQPPRVYKLQFDARRIICCSSTPVIVGWDFANGDEQIIEASRFFAPIE